MWSPTRALRDRLLKFAGELRFPRLLALTVAIFVADLAFPDLLPFADEILLGLLAALLATLKKKRREHALSDPLEGPPARLASRSPEAPRVPD